MFEFVKGKFVEARFQEVVVDVNGVGYRLFVPPNYDVRMPVPGTEVAFYTSFVVREMSQTLYGFRSKEERDFFEILITLSGVGPKMAVTVIGHLTIADLQQAIHNHDTTLLCRVPGIGKKTAERLIIEIKDKVPSLLEISSGVSSEAHSTSSHLINDAVRALINLGYQQTDARKTVEEIIKNSKEDLDLTSLLSKALGSGNK